MKDGRSTDESAKSSGISLKRTEPKTKPWRTAKVRGYAEEMCGGTATAEVRDESYEVNYCSEREEMPNQATEKDGVVKSVKGGG